MIGGSNLTKVYSIVVLIVGINLEVPPLPLSPQLVPFGRLCAVRIASGRVRSDLRYMVHSLIINREPKEIGGWVKTTDDFLLFSRCGTKRIDSFGIYLPVVFFFLFFLAKMCF